MKAKYFTAEDPELATALATQYFKCDETSLVIETITKGDGIINHQILAYYEPSGTLETFNASYSLYYEEDGVYLEIYEERNGGLSLDRILMLQQLQRKQIDEFEPDRATNLAAKGWGRTRVAPPQIERYIPEELQIEISKDELECIGVLLSPEPRGALLTRSQALDVLANEGVTYGIDVNVIDKMLEEKNYGRPYIIAKGIPPQNGADGKLIFHFDTEKKLARPKLLEDGKVDYKTLDVIEQVEEGKLLVSRRRATAGMTGVSVKSEDIQPKPGKEVKMPRSKNTTVNEENTAMYAQTSGLVEYIKGSVNVSSIYKVNGDCDYSVGNIDFDGSVYITGSVISGTTIKASGAVLVDGVVEASIIEAGGNVEIKRGIQGMDKGKITAGGSISMLFIERGVAIAGENINVDYIIHSDIEAGGSLNAIGRRGSIIGGVVRVAGEITANTIGSVSHTQTEFEVGLVPHRRVRIAELEVLIAEAEKERDKLDKIEAYLEKTRTTMANDAWMKIAMQAKMMRKRYTRQSAKLDEEYELLKQEAEMSVLGKVHVFGEAHPGVKITIASSVYKVTEPINRATFKVSQGEVVFGPCEAKKR